MLTHKISVDKASAEPQVKTAFIRTHSSMPRLSAPSSFTRRSATGTAASEKACFYCKKPGHLIAECPVLSKKQNSAKPVALVKSVENSATKAMAHEIAKCELAGSVPFLMDGFVSLVCDPSSRKPIKIWRDSGAFQSLILQDVLPFCDNSALG